MKILDRLMTALRLRKPAAPAEPKAAKRVRPTQHQNSREVERRLRQQQARDAKNRS